MREHEAEIAAIVENPGPPTFSNTIDALELAGQGLESDRRGLLEHHGNGFRRKICAPSNANCRPFSHGIIAAISLNEGLFARVAALYDQRESLTLTDEQARLLELTYKSFIRTGARLEGADRARFAEIAEQLASLEMAVRPKRSRRREQFRAAAG